MYQTVRLRLTGASVWMWSPAVPCDAEVGLAFRERAQDPQTGVEVHLPVGEHDLGVGGQGIRIRCRHEQGVGRLRVGRRDLAEGPGPERGPHARFLQQGPDLLGVERVGVGAGVGLEDLVVLVRGPAVTLVLVEFDHH
jgi:hypothetical protein